MKRKTGTKKLPVTYQSLPFVAITKDRKVISNEESDKPKKKSLTKGEKKKQHQILITQVHMLNKRREELVTKLQLDNKQVSIKSKINEIDEELEKLGGLATYQRASKMGESRFNSNSFLLEKLELNFKNWSKERSNQLRLLDVGALGENYTKQASFIQCDPIDLNPVLPSIKKADFLLLPIPSKKYDIISLSLVINFVGDPLKRGEMIYKCYDMLTDNILSTESKGYDDKLDNSSSGYLYIVLPRPCIDNSRYMTLDHFLSITKQLGFNLIAQKFSPKLAFFILQKRIGTVFKTKPQFKKKVLLDGPAKNNFSICL